MQMEISVLERNDIEITSLVKNGQYIGMALQPSIFEQGFTRFSISRRAYNPGDLFLSPRDRRIFVRHIRARYLLVKVSDKVLAGLDEQGEIARIQNRRDLKDRRIQGLMVALNAERISGYPSGHLFLDSVELALCTILRQGYSERIIRIPKKLEGLAPFRLRKVLELIDDNLQGGLSLEQLASTAGLSISHFSREFKKSIGLSPHQYLLKKRLHRSEELIQRSDVRILDVALACGFKSQQHFARVFRKEFGINPVEYKYARQMQGDNFTMSD